MSIFRFARVLAAATFAAASIASPAAAAIRLLPVLSGASSPVLVTNAGDNSGRLFIVERGGRIKLLQRGSTIPTLFLDISNAGLAAGGEQGLLGLAFHPQYSANGRFFIFYTRSDNAIVIAEHHVTVDPDVADPAGTVVLVIPHPGATNHNGGMLAFGSDGYLYAGVGDGGGANDPSNNAQNINQLLGKILRLDIDPPVGAGVPYVSPASNPFFGATPGRDEIYAVGMRNPWRFSFDRTTGQQWVGDVGQGASEEVDSPLVAGGNYGWRIYEGFNCTGIDGGLCNPSNFVMPAFQYGHSGGRCSLTGGYVYRGAQNILAHGTYVYADYCSGEVFAWDGVAQTVLLDTTMNISSFGEDEYGELYVIDLAGGVYQLALDTVDPIRLGPVGAGFGPGGGRGRVTVAAGGDTAWTAASHASWLTVTSGASGAGDGVVTYRVAPLTGRTRSRTGTMTVGGETFTVTQRR